MKLTDIATAWYRVVSGNITPEQKEMASKRLSVCDSCPHKLQMNAAGELMMNMLNQADNTFYCGQCGCPLASKVVHEDSKCPVDRWPRKEPEAEYF